MRGPNRKTVHKARRLRRQSTAAETELWLALRNRRLRGFKFVRQEAVGPYIVDFLCRGQMLIIEVDGGQHAENITDATRETYLRNEGFRLIRFWNNDVLSNLDGVLQKILSALHYE